MTTSATHATQIDPAALAAFEATFRGPLLRAGAPGYDEARRLWNGLIDRRPALIAQARGSSDVVSAIAFAQRAGLPLSVKGGGHNVSGSALVEDGLTIDLSQMSGVSVDRAKRTAHVQGGATLADVDRETQLIGLATPTGNISETGIAGLTLNGGMGNMRRKHGLSVDNLVSATVATADGRLLRAAEDENPDLFWGLRGGGGNFGVATSFEFQLHDLGPDVYVANQIFPIADAPRLLPIWRDFVEAAPDEISSIAFFWTAPRIDAFPPELRGEKVFLYVALYAGPVEEGERALEPLVKMGAPIVDFSGPGPYVARQSAFDPFFCRGPIHPEFYAYWKSIYLNGLADGAIDDLIAMAETLPSEQALIALWHLGGAVARRSDDATAFGKRSAPYMLSFDTSWTDPSLTERAIAWTRERIEAVKRYSPGGLYLNFPGVGEDMAALAREAYGANYPRLAEIKRAYDPGNVFRMNQNIEPA